MHLAEASFGNLLRLKPLVYMNQGNSSAHRVRTRQKAMARLFEWLDKHGPFDQLGVVHAGVLTRAEELREQARSLPDYRLSQHLGPQGNLLTGADYLIPVFVLTASHEQ